MAKAAHSKNGTRGSVPSSSKELLKRCKRIGFPITRGGSGHPRIWISGEAYRGRSVTVPATSSDYRSMLNSIMFIRAQTGIDLRTV